MGSWFGNLSVRKTAELDENRVVEYIRSVMAARGYQEVPSEEEGDCCYAIFSPDDSEWITLYSDGFAFEGPTQVSELALPMSAELQSDVLGVACFDSDYLFLNLINAADGIDAWASVGSSAGLGIGRRANLSAWKGKVSDFALFKECFKKKYVFAEEVLYDAAGCLGLPGEQSAAGYEYLEELEAGEGAKRLFFKLPAGLKSQEPPKMRIVSYSGMPWYVNQPAVVSALNQGGESKGLSIAFLGTYVENDEITFSDVCFVVTRRGEHVRIPVELKKVQLPDGQWIYSAGDAALKIPPKISGELAEAKRYKEQLNREINVHFVPRGDPRKVLDIVVGFIPKENPVAGQVWCNVWMPYGSKKAYFESFNARHSRLKGFQFPELREEDFD